MGLININVIMKKGFYIVSLLMLALSGCQKSDVANPDRNAVVSDFRGELEELLDTRTTLDKNNNVRWSEGDQIIIFNGFTLGGKYQVTDDSVGETSAGFDYIENATGGFVSGSDIDHNVALYPFDSKVKCAKGDDKEPTESYVLTKVKALSVQNYVADSFGPGSFPMVAVTSSVSDYRLNFKNVFGGMKLQLKGDCTVSSITVKGQASEPIAGTVSVTAFVDGSAPTVSMGADATASVTLDCGEYGVELNEETATNFIIALPPTTFKSGFTVSIVDTEGRQMTIKTSKENKVYRSSLLKMPEITLEPSEVEVISFADSQVKEACVAAFDSDGDGEVSYEEAAAAESLAGVFDQYKTIKSFDELQYFTSITSIPSELFKECTMLESITFPESLRTIGSSAFQDCPSLSSIVIPDNVTEIGDVAFCGCSNLASVTLGSGLTSTGYFTFAFCSSLSSISIPDNVTSIGYNAFYGCSSLSSIVIPDNVTEIGNGAFWGCSNLASATLGSGLISIGMMAFYNCSSLSSIVIPDNVTEIGDNAFSGCSNLSSATLGSGLTSIGAGAFSYCSRLSSIVIPDNVTEMGYHVFQDCSNLESVTLGSGLTSIVASTFYGCSSLSSIVIPDNLTEIGENAFYGCSSLSSIVVPDNVTEIGGYAFYSCSNLASATLGSGLTSIGDHAFYDCSSLSSIVIPDNVTELGNSAFSGCSNLTSATLVSGLTSIGGSAFSGCSSLSSIVVPDNVTEIGGYAFYSCSNLASVTLGSGLTSIGDNAFWYCRNLATVVCRSVAPPTMGTIAFIGNKSDLIIYVPEASVEVYKSSWPAYASSIQAMTESM